MFSKNEKQETNEMMIFSKHKNISNNTYVISTTIYTNLEDKDAEIDEETAENKANTPENNEFRTATMNL